MPECVQTVRKKYEIDQGQGTPHVQCPIWTSLSSYWGYIRTDRLTAAALAPHTPPIGNPKCRMKGEARFCDLLLSVEVKKKKKGIQVMGNPIYLSLSLFQLHFPHLWYLPSTSWDATTPTHLNQIAPSPQIALGKPEKLVWKLASKSSQTETSTRHYRRALRHRRRVWLTAWH